MKVNSTFIKEVKYKEVVLDVLDIVFKNGKTYRYYDVPRTVVKEFTKAKSKGRFFTAKIKDNYFFEEL